MLNVSSSIFEGIHLFQLFNKQSKKNMKRHLKLTDSTTDFIHACVLNFSNNRFVKNIVKSNFNSQNFIDS